MEFNNVLLEKEGNIATVTINRPKALNALNSETLKELNAVIEDLENDNNIYCVILTGSGEKSFVAGADIAEMKEQDLAAFRRNRHSFWQMSPPGHWTVRIPRV